MHGEARSVDSIEDHDSRLRLKRSPEKSLEMDAGLMRKPFFSFFAKASNLVEALMSSPQKATRQIDQEMMEIRRKANVNDVAA